MARLIVTPCVTCGAPLELPDAGAVEARCPFCGTTNEVRAGGVAPTSAQPELRLGLLFGGLVGGLVLFVGVAVFLGFWLESDDADHVLHLRELQPEDTSGLWSATRAARMPDGSLWMACKHDRLCGVDAAGRWLGTVELPHVDYRPGEATLRYGNTRGMTADGSGRLYVSYDASLLEISVTERRVVGRIDVLPEGEHPRCLATAPDDTISMMTSEDDLVTLGADRSLRTRVRQPLLQQDPRHHGCDTLTFDGAGNLWVSPEAAPAIYVFSPSGALARRHVPGGPGHYMGLAVLADGSAVVGYGYELLLLGPDFTPRTGPQTSRRPGWAEVSEVMRAPDDTLIVTTLLGTIARWEGVSGRW